MRLRSMFLNYMAVVVDNEESAAVEQIDLHADKAKAFRQLLEHYSTNKA